eukprot:364897-Chlamydomonas_euryale.AAC.3
MTDRSKHSADGPIVLYVEMDEGHTSQQLQQSRRFHGLGVQARHPGQKAHRAVRLRLYAGGAAPCVAAPRRTPPRGAVRVDRRAISSPPLPTPLDESVQGERTRWRCLLEGSTHSKARSDSRASGRNVRPRPLRARAGGGGCRGGRQPGAVARRGALPAAPQRAAGCMDAGGPRERAGPAAGAAHDGVSGQDGLGRQRPWREWPGRAGTIEAMA